NQPPPHSPIGSAVLESADRGPQRRGRHGDPERGDRQRGSQDDLHSHRAPRAILQFGCSRALTRWAGKLQTLGAGWQGIARAVRIRHNPSNGGKASNLILEAKMAITAGALIPQGARVRVRRANLPLDPSAIGRIGTVVDSSEYHAHCYGVILDGEEHARVFAAAEL